MASCVARLTDAGPTIATIDIRDDVLKDLARAIGTRLFATDLLAGLKTIDFAVRSTLTAGERSEASRASEVVTGRDAIVRS